LKKKKGDNRRQEMQVNLSAIRRGAIELIEQEFKDGRDLTVIYLHMGTEQLMAMDNANITDQYNRMLAQKPHTQRYDDTHIRSAKISDTVFIDYRFTTFFVPTVFVEGKTAREYAREDCDAEPIHNLAGILSCAFRRQYGNPQTYVAYMICRKVATPGGELIDE
jgi:hypothetical protein